MNAAVRYRAGLIGTNIKSSPNPSLHKSEAQALGLDYSYDLIELETQPGGVSSFKRVIEQAEREGYTGLNLSYPVKQQVIALVHELSPTARALHAVNTVVFRKGRRTGHNTDWWGFAESFKRGLPGVPLKRVALIGAGSAGAAAAFAILKLGAREICIFDIESARATQLASRMLASFPDRRLLFVDTVQTAIAAADGIIQATPMSMAGLPAMAISPELLHPGLWFAEVFYAPLETELLRTARGKGCQVLDGSDMAIFQAAMSLELFTGIKPDVERMRANFTSQSRTASPDV